jgi:hypothetical protein
MIATKRRFLSGPYIRLGFKSKLEELYDGEISALIIVLIVLKI